MSEPAKKLHGAKVEYSGVLTQPERWATWAPNVGDIIVSTPAKCGTTWTQTMIAMLLYGTADLPDRVSALSPWVDSSLGDADSVASVPKSPSGRRLVKTHTPTDGFPIWDGVTVVAVYRHPLDVFLSIRKHVENMKGVENEDLCGPMKVAVEYYVNGEYRRDNIDQDFLGSVTGHYSRTVHRSHQTGLVLFHYADMIADHRGTVERLARALKIDHDPALIDAVTKASAFNAMKADAKQFAPEGGKGFWHEDTAFFDRGGTGKWTGILDEDDVATFETALKAQLPDAADRAWIKNGSSGPGA